MTIRVEITAEEQERLNNNPIHVGIAATHRLIKHGAPVDPRCIFPLGNAYGQVRTWTEGTTLVLEWHGRTAQELDDAMLA